MNSSRLICACSALLFLVSATAAHAAAVRVDTTYVNGATTVSTEAFFNTSGISGIGTEWIKIEEFNMIFSSRGYWQQAAITPVETPFPEKTLVAIFTDGVLSQFTSVDSGGNSTTPVSPPSNWLGENIRLAKNELVDYPCCAGFTRYSLSVRSGLNPVPLPSAGWLFFSALGALVAKHWK